jgi:hypothetical protein
MKDGDDEKIYYSLLQILYEAALNSPHIEHLKANGYRSFAFNR